MPAIAPSYISATLANEFYRTEEEYEQALADALREEYRAIVDAGFVLQVDDPRLVTYYMMNPNVSVEDCRRWAAKRGDSLYMCYAETGDVGAITRRLARHHARFTPRGGDPLAERDGLWIHPSALSGLLLGISRTTVGWEWSGRPELVTH